MSKVIPFSGVPSFFRAACRDAAEQYCGLSYSDAGYNLAGALSSLVPFGVSDDDWSDALEELEAMLDQNNLELALRWLCTWLPKCMALVPIRRREGFVEGVQRYYLEEWGRI